MKVCKNCKGVNQDGALFCITCNCEQFTILSNKFPFESQAEFEASERRRREKLDSIKVNIMYR